LAIGAATKLPIASIAVYGDALTARIVTAKGGAGEGVFREMPRIIGHCPQKSFKFLQANARRWRPSFPGNFSCFFCKLSRWSF
jgi:hypothetical protein